MIATFRVELNPGQTPNPPYVAKLTEDIGATYKREKLPITNLEIEHTPDHNYRIFANEVYEVEKDDVLEIVGDWRVNGKRVAGTVFLVQEWNIVSRLGSNYRVPPEPEDKEHISIPLFPEETMSKVKAECNNPVFTGPVEFKKTDEVEPFAGIATERPF